MTWRYPPELPDRDATLIVAVRRGDGTVDVQIGSADSHPFDDRRSVTFPGPGPTALPAAELAGWQYLPSWVEAGDDPDQFSLSMFWRAVGWIGYHGCGPRIWLPDLVDAALRHVKPVKPTRRRGERS